MDKAQIWKRLHGARPTRLAVARVARWADASVHSSMGFYNFPSAGSFRREVRALVRWYSKGKRVSRWRRGIARAANASPRVRGIRCVITKKVRAHMRRLRKPLRVEGMTQWRRVALTTRQAGVPVQSGTVAVERFWGMMKSMLPPAARHLSLRWFSVLSMFVVVQYNWSHVNPTLPGTADQDPLMAQRIHTLGIVAEASGREGASSLDHFAPLFELSHVH